MPALNSVRSYTKALALRARIALRDNQIQEAIAASTAMYSVGRAMSLQATDVPEMLVGLAITRDAVQLWCNMLSHSDLTVDNLDVLNTLLDSYPSTSGGKALDVLDRLTILSLVRATERYGMAGFNAPFSGPFGGGGFSAFWDPLLAFANWEKVYSRINQRMDSHVDVLLESDTQKRHEQFQELQLAEANTLLDIVGELNPIYLLSVPVWHTIDQLFLDNWTRWYERVEQSQVEIEILRTCIATKKFHLEHARYPESLDELVGGYIQSVPTDFKTGEPVKYRRLTNGALIYTLGRNQEDNDGWGRGNLLTKGRDASGRSRNDPYDDVTYLVGEDDRQPPDGLVASPLRIVGRIVDADGNGFPV